MCQNQTYFRNAADTANQETKKIISLNFHKSTILYLMHKYQLRVEGICFFNF